MICHKQKYIITVHLLCIILLEENTACLSYASQNFYFSDVCIQHVFKCKILPPPWDKIRNFCNLGKAVLFVSKARINVF